MNKKVFHLKESKVFCMAPWTHIANIPNGDILPCCISLDGSMGNLYETDIKEIWNNDRYREIRRNMLNEIESKHCQRCYKEESWGNPASLRNTFNSHLEKHYDTLLGNTSDDGYLDDMRFLRWDFRFSNLCNLACTTCSPHYSSTWVPIAKEIYLGFEMPQFNTSNINRDKFLNTIKDQANIVEEIYFAGGEPLIQAEHYEILDHLKQNDRLKDVTVTYSTNLTSLEYNSIDVTDYLSQVKNLRLLISIDEIDADRLYYIRFPAKIDKIVENLKKLNNKLTQHGHTWAVTPTWSLMNLHRIKEIISFFKDNNLLPHNFSETLYWEYDIHNIILMHPEHLSISCASPEWKQNLRNKLKDYREWYIQEMIPLKNQRIQSHAIKVIDDCMKRFNASIDENVSFDKQKWLSWISSLDKARKTNFVETFPELNWHLQ